MQGQEQEVHIGGSATSSAPGAAEIFCGSAGLSKAMAAQGFRVLAIDWRGNTHKAAVEFQKIDLTTMAGQDHAMHLLAGMNLKFVHFAPPCGTFSRAREFPVPEAAKLRGKHAALVLWDVDAFVDSVDVEALI